MKGVRAVVIGASAGGVTALFTVLGALPARVDVDVCRFGDFRRVEVERQDTETGDGPAADTDDEIVCGIRAGSREFTAAAGRATAAVGRAVDCRSSVRSQRSCLIVEYGACAAIAVSDAVVGERDAASRRVAHLRIVACGFFRLWVSVNLCDFCFRAARNCIKAW